MTRVSSAQELFNVRVYLHMFIMAIILIGALNWGIIGIWKVNILESIIENVSARRFIYALVGAAGLYLVFSRSTWLPFLGENILPEAVLRESRPKHYEKEIVVQTIPNATVIYWAADSPNKKIVQKIQRWDSAYGKFENSGIVKSDKRGVARVFIDCPQEYSAGIGKLIPKHLHYRIVKEWYMSPIYTINLEDTCMKKELEEHFEDSNEHEKNSDNSSEHSDSDSRHEQEDFEDMQDSEEIPPQQRKMNKHIQNEIPEDFSKYSMGDADEEDSTPI